MSVQIEIELQELVSKYKTILAQRINANINITDIHSACQDIKLMPQYDTALTTEEKAILNCL